MKFLGYPVLAAKRSDDSDALRSFLDDSTTTANGVDELGSRRPLRQHVEAVVKSGVIDDHRVDEARFGSLAVCEIHPTGGPISHRGKTQQFHSGSAGPDPGPLIVTGLDISAYQPP